MMDEEIAKAWYVARVATLEHELEHEQKITEFWRQKSLAWRGWAKSLLRELQRDTNVDDEQAATVIAWLARKAMTGSRQRQGLPWGKVTQ